MVIRGAFVCFMALRMFPTGHCRMPV